MKKHILPLLLAALLCASVLPSCGESDTKETHSSNGEQVGTEDTAPVETTDPTRVPPAFTDNLTDRNM